MSQLRACASCTRHIRIAETSCPFCNAKLSLAARLGAVSVAVAFGASLAACYGGPPPPAMRPPPATPAPAEPAASPK